MEAVSPPRLPRRTQAVFTREQARRLIQQAPSDALGNLWITLLGTGIRIGEALALQWGDLENGTVSIRRSLVELPGQGRVPLLGEPKSHPHKFCACGAREAFAQLHAAAVFGVPAAGLVS